MDNTYLVDLFNRNGYYYDRSINLLKYSCKNSNLIIASFILIKALNYRFDKCMFSWYLGACFAVEDKLSFLVTKFVALYNDFEVLELPCLKLKMLSDLSCIY